MLAGRRVEAERLGVPGDLIEDVLRRVMRESYASEKDTGFKCINPALGKIVIIGGEGSWAGCLVTCSRSPATGSRRWNRPTGRGRTRSWPMRDW